MTALRHLARPLTIAEFAMPPEDEAQRWELVEGNLLMSPSPRPGHMVAIGRRLLQLAAQLPSDLEAVPDVDIDLQLEPPHEPGTARRPDLVVIPREALRRVDATGEFLRAADVLLVVEVVPPGSRRTDRVVKRAEYADAGVPNYWIIDLDPRVSVTECHLAGEFGYQDGGERHGRLDTDRPCPLSIDLDAVTSR